jgi:hypothetical protein
MYQREPEPSLGELFAELTREMTTLVRQEVRLAGTEVSQKVTGVGRHIGMLAAGGLIAYAGFLALVAAIVMLLANVIAWWLSALIVGLVVAGIGYFMVRRGMDALKQVDLMPRQTVATIKEDIAWAKDQTT